MKRLLVFALLTVIGLSTFAQKSNIRTAVIQTNGVSEQCKTRMMNNVPQWKGVKQCSYDIKTAKLTVSYDANQTTVEAICQGISKLGYDANNVKADPAARAKLPACCRQDKKTSGCGGCS